MRRLFIVTGATGLIGAPLVRQLLEGGGRVRVLVRFVACLPPDLRERVEVAVGDIRDPAAVRRAVTGAHTVLHLAGLARAWTRDPAIFTATNVDGVRNVLEAARRHDVERLVHVSTVLTLERGAGAPAATPYERSKLAGERLVAAYAQEVGDAVIVHPTRVFGPGPLNDANGVTRMIHDYLCGRFRFRIADGGARANYVHAFDVAAGIRLAAERGRSGGHYVLGGDGNLTVAELLDRVATLAGRRRRVVPIPPPLARGIGLGGELWGRIAGRTSLTRAWVEVFLRDQPADITAARRELGYAPHALDRRLRETLAWLASASGTGP